jgi:hypothetical protein
VVVGGFSVVGNRIICPPLVTGQVSTLARGVGGPVVVTVHSRRVGAFFFFSFFPHLQKDGGEFKEGCS